MIPNNVRASMLSIPRLFPFAENTGCTPSAWYQSTRYQPDCEGTLREIRFQEILHYLLIYFGHFIHILGSILGPLLFIIYINDLCNASKLFKIINYADDTTLYSTLDVFGNYISKKLNLEMTKVADWLKLNKLSINIKKSKFMVFHMPQNKWIYQI